MSDRERSKPSQEEIEENLEKEIEELETAFGGLCLIAIPYFASWPENIMKEWERYNLEFAQLDWKKRDWSRTEQENRLKSILENAKQLISAACLIKPEELTNDKLVKVAESSPPNRLSFKRPKETIH